MKAEVFSWRVSAKVKADLEREARARKVPVSAILDPAVRDDSQQQHKTKEN